MKKLYKFLLIIVVNATFALGSFAQSNIVSQSFEGSGTWNYVEFPAPYTVYSPPSDIWGICGNTYVTTPVNPNGSSWFTYNNGDVVAPLLSGISSASEGSHYFGICDINNPYTVNVSWPADPGSLWHTITFDPVPLPGSGTFPIKLAFDYYTVGFDGTDYIGWEVIWDNGTTWNALTTTSNSNTNTWTTKEFNAPSGATSVRLRVAVKQNGGTDFGAFDNFRVFLDVGDLTPPSVNSIHVVDDVTLLLTTSEEVVNATDISNYGGIGVTSATVNSTGDSITLNLSAPLLIGQYTDIYVSSLTDVASNVMINDTLTVVFNNADLSTGLTITELMYNDPGNYDNIAFIEFHNTSSSPIPLGGLRIDDAISFVFPEFDLQAGDFAILAKGSFSGSSPCNTYPSGCGFETFFGFAPTFEWWTGYLSTSGELISVVNTQGDLVVDLAYDDSWAGGVGDGDGYSIVRCDPLSDINVDTNWTPAITVAIPACGTCTAGLGIGTTTIYAHPMISCPIVYNGCMDTLAINYDPLANVDDGSCFFANNVGCTDSIATNYDPVFTVDDGSCIYPVAPMVNLYFSEFAEGSSNNKYFEIFNPTSDTVDLSNYAYPSTSNAPTTVGVYEYWNTFANGAIILPNDVYVVAHPFSDPAILAEADETHNYLSNGDDGYALVYGSEPSSPVGPSVGGYVILDFIGDWNGDPGSGWAVAGVSNATQNHTLVRKCDVVQGNTDWILSAGTDAVNSEWIVLPINDWSELGFFNPCSSINYGCMDATANNYDPNATIDDGSCTYTVLGCTDSTAINFDPLANVDDGSCIASVLGCTDPVATNFDPLANVDDGTCSYTNTVLGCTDPLAFNYDPLANTDDGSCIAIVNGCTDPSAGNYDATANVDDGSCLLALVNLYFTEYAEGSSNNKYLEIFNPSSDTVDLSNYAYPNVSNDPTTVGVYEWWNPFDAGAVILPNDVYVIAHGSADPVILAEADETHNYLSNGDDGYALVYGSEPSSPVGPSVGGYVILDFIGDWNGDPGSGWAVAGVSNATQNHTLVRKCDVVQGNTDWILSAGTDAVNSEWIVLPINDWSELGFFNPCSSINYGCMDATANNYDPNATIDDGSCTYTVLGCTDSTAINFDPLANVDDGSCIASVLGCTDPVATNFDPLANVDDGTCSYTNTVLGCTDPLAFNYDPLANTDDGSCIAIVNGCTDPSAGNYDATANVDDGSCLGPLANLYFSEYAEGNSNNKYLEIYNPSSDTISLTDYGYPSVSNAPNSAGVYEYWNSFDSGATIAPGGIYVIAHPSADPAILTFANETHMYLSNGDDGYALVYGSEPSSPVGPSAGGYVILDFIGDWNGDPGSGWAVAGVSNATQNHTLVRKCDVVQGNSNWSLSAGTDSLSSEWLVMPNEDWSNLGNHTTPCTVAILGCTDSTANNYNATATLDDGSCTYTVLGCTDATAYNYDPAATVDDGSCIATVYGCTDASQSNYDPAANVDDGSCIPVVLGCTDPLAVNYNATVNTDDGSCLYSGCTDPAASNYDANATIDDGSCSYGPSLCAGSAITGLSVSDIIHDRATFNFDNMNTYDATGAQVCRVDQIRIKYRPVGTSSWSQKNMAQPTGYDAVTGICNSTQNTAKITRNLMSSTTYEWEVKVWYCDGQNSGFVAGPNFTTADDCPNVGNLTAVGANPTMATFAWDNSNGAYSFVRLKARVDSISNPTGSDFFQIGGAGVSYGIYTKNKQNMVPGETYRGQARTYCDPNGGPYRSPSWSPLVFWTQPTVRIEGGVSIANLDVYPNPSRDVFNVAFTSEDVQDLEVRVINVVGEVVYTENLQQFVGEYTKLIDLAENTKGVYFLEITTNTGVVNKKLMLQ